MRSHHFISAVVRNDEPPMCRELDYDVYEVVNYGSVNKGYANFIYRLLIDFNNKRLSLFKFISIAVLDFCIYNEITVCFYGHSY